MHYRWKNAPLESLFDAIRSEKLHYDSWLLITCDEVASDSSTHPPLTSLWFSSLEETVHYIEERLVPLWISPGEKELRAELLAASAKLLATRRLTPKVVNDWRTQFNRKMAGKVQLRWLGLIDDLIRAEDPAIEEISGDLEFWLGDNGVELSDLDLETPKHQRLTIEFLVQLGS